MVNQTCAAKTSKGDRCRAKPVSGGDLCFMHDPAHASEAAEARRLGGLRRRREKTLSTAYDFEGLNDVHQIRRLLEIAALDTLGLENSVARSRTIASIALAALKALEVAEFEERVDALEEAVKQTRSGRG